MSACFSNTKNLALKSLNNHISQEHNNQEYNKRNRFSYKNVFVIISFITWLFYSLITQANSQLIGFAEQIIEETKTLQSTALSTISSKQSKELNNHLKSTISQLEQSIKKLKKGNVNENHYIKARDFVELYLSKLNKKVSKGEIELDVATLLEADANIIITHINQLISGNIGNIPPVANAGLDQSVPVGEVVTLDGSGSSDGNGDALGFQWSIIAQPAGSQIVLSDNQTATPEFIPYLSGLYQFDLIVSDAQSSSVADSVIVNVASTNTAPVASAGTNQSGNVGDKITLDASGSSDAEGDSLAYFWSLTTLPVGSVAILNDNTVLMPNFIADLPGLYQSELIVNDGDFDSAPDSININIGQLNTAPVANAGPDQSAYTDEMVMLDGSASYDIDGDLLHWLWNILSSPAGSTSQLDNPNSVTPTFIPDSGGQYIIQLVVDDSQDNSQSDSVVINVSKANTLPVANAGLDQSGFIGDLMTLDGNASFDADNDNLNFVWSLIAIPSGSQASLDYPDSVDPAFNIDLPGDYVAQLMVNDGQANSAPDEVIISTLNSRPVANAGAEQVIFLSETIQLDASASSDADGDLLTYRWSISSQPTGSTASLSDSQSINPSFEADLIGPYIFQLIVSDGNLDSIPSTVSLTVNPAESLSLSVTNPAEDFITNQSEIIFSGYLNHQATLTLNNQEVFIQNDLSFNYPIILVEGVNHFSLEAVDAVGTQVIMTRQITLDTQEPSLPQLDLITISEPDTNEMTTIRGEASSVEAYSEVVIRNIDTNDVVITIADAQGAFNIQLSIDERFGYSLLAQDAAGNQSEIVSIIESNGTALPPDPASIAPALNPTQSTSLYDAVSFLYSGSHPIQTGVDPEDIEAKRVAVLKGKVLNRDNTPLSGVTITIKDHAEFGQTLSREDGHFDMVVNGGGLLTINYQKESYLPVQRKLKSPWRDFAHADDVVMIPVDSQVTMIDLNNNQTTQIAQGSVQTDADGSRQATMMFSPGTTASMILPDGSTQELTSLNVRATEYTVGENGPETMPGPLPATSGYTYAVELSVDEAIEAGATTVEFNQAVNVYVDNFLNFPIGEIVPAGYYDYSKAAWIPSQNGKVIKIINHTNGLADISLDVSGAIATQGALDAAGITHAEQTELALIYLPGTSLWRVPVNHLTPWDFNMPYGPPLDAIGPEADDPKTEEPTDEPCEQAGCIIEAENQVLGERISITGSAFNLNYRSSRTLGNRTNVTLTIPLSKENLPASLKSIELIISIAGRVIRQNYPVSSNQVITWEWDGLDVYGRQIFGGQTATVQINYLYDVVYYSARSDLEASFANPTAGTDVKAIGVRGSQEIRLSKIFRKKLGSFAATQAGLGGWSLSPHHVYDPISQTLYFGDGSQRRADTLNSRIIATVAGNGNWGFSGDGGPAIQAMLQAPEGIAIGPQGEVYIADASNNRIRKVDPDGIITTIAGNGDSGYAGDGGLAIDATLNAPESIAIGPDGNLYIADDTNNRIRKIDSGGVISTVAGNGIQQYSGDGGLAVDASLSSPEGIAIGAEGELYIADSGNNRIRRVGADGIITTIAGNGAWEYSGDQGLATEAGLAYPRRVSVGLQGELYIADIYNNRVRKVTTDGLISTVAGNGLRGFSGDGGLAVDAMLAYPGGITVGSEGELYIVDIVNGRIRIVGTDGIINTLVGIGEGSFSGDGGLAANAGLNYPLGIEADPEGGLYIADYSDHRIRRIGSAWQGFSIADFSIPSANGQQLFHFDISGRHFRTLDTITGEVIYRFTYTATGQLDNITDMDGNITQIQRDINGLPLAIIAPFGQTTSLGLNVNEYLSEVRNPLGNSNQINYNPDGLMTSYTNPNNANSSFQYDSLGRLLQDVSPENGGWVLNRSDSDNGYSVSMTSAEGRSTLFQVDTLSTGNRQRMTTAPDGIVTTQLTKTDGEKISTLPDGTIVTTKEGPDPRFGMLAPVATDMTIQTPGGMLFSAFHASTAILADSDDPLSVTLLTETSNVNGRVSTSQYDAPTQTWTGTSAAGRLNSVQIDNKGRPMLSQVSGLDASSYSYDSHGRLSLITEGSGTLARNTLFSFYQSGPMDGYLQSITNAENQITSYEYDAAGRITKEILPDNREILYSFDANGNINSLTPPGKMAHIFNYDGLDQSIQYTPPPVTDINNPQTVYTYNRDKQLTQIVRPDGQEVNLNYGAISGKLDSISIPSGTINYAYDSGSGQLSSITAPDSGVLSFNYDGSLNTQIQWSGEISGTFTQSFDNDFRVIQRAINGGNSIIFQYDNDNLLIQAGNLNISRENQKGGLINGTTLGSLTTSRAHNGFAELETFNAAYNEINLFAVNYSRDKLGRIIQKTETIDGISTTKDYQYDLAGRLISETNSNITRTYTYDSNGNRTHVNDVTIGNYDEQDRMTAYGSTEYQYTANGELLSKTEAGLTTLYDYDILGNLKQVTLSDGTLIDYIIDGSNRRIGKKVNGILKQGFLYKDNLNPIVELDGNNQIISRFIYGAKTNVPNSMVKDGNTYRIISDHLGSPRLVVDSYTGEIVQRIDYDTWGNIVQDTNPGFQPFGFAGGLYDQHTQLMRFGVRDYDAWAGRWTSKDLIGFDGGDFNLYGYVINDPVNLTDPTGLIYGDIELIHHPITKGKSGKIVGRESVIYYKGKRYATYRNGGWYSNSGKYLGKDTRKVMNDLASQDSGWDEAAKKAYCGAGHQIFDAGATGLTLIPGGQGAGASLGLANSVVKLCICDIQ